jgi:HAD superfamily hydrolase (TIGR01549 family)
MPAESGAAPRARLWLFDFDNTLAALEPVVDWAASRRALEPMLRALGVPEELFAKIPKGNLPLYDALLARLAHDGGSRLDQRAREILKRASAHIESYEFAGADRAEPLPGALELLGLLRERQVATGIVTSNSSRTVARWLERFGIADSMRTIVGRDSLLPLKPSPAMLVRALEASATAARDALYAGDSEGDVAASRAAGIAFVGITWKPGSRETLARAGTERLFASPAELLEALRHDAG